jgi:hypothetical protein
MTPITLDAIIREARAENAEHARLVALAVRAKLKQFIAKLRPAKARPPRTEACLNF